MLVEHILVDQDTQTDQFKQIIYNEIDIIYCLYFFGIGIQSFLFIKEFDQDYIILIRFMASLTPQEVRNLMNNQNNLRNISIAGQKNSGVTAISDRLISKGGIVSKPQRYSIRYCDRWCQDQRHRAFIQTNNVLMHYKYDFTSLGNKQEQFLLNVNDYPKKFNYGQQINSTLRIIDGILVVVDIIEYSQGQIHNIIKHAIHQKVKPALMINKVDRSISELQLDGEQIYQSFVKVIDKVNNAIQTYKSLDMSNCKIDALVGNVAFGSANDNWSFTLNKFAHFYAKKFGISQEKMLQKLWGDHYFNTTTNEWQNNNQTQDKQKLQRGFVQFIMDPIIKLIKALQNSEIEAYTKILDVIQLKLTQQETTLTGKFLSRAVLGRWLPISNCLFEMIISSLPSPCQAQQYRTKYLYEGPSGDAVYQAMKKCDPKGPLMIYISNMIPSADKGRFYAYGRIFSGTVSVGQKARIIGVNYKTGKKEGIYEKNIQRVLLVTYKCFQPICDAPCGNIIALTGLDQYLIKNGTIGSAFIPIEQAFSIRHIKYSTVPVLKVIVSPKIQADLPRLIEGLKRLSKSDQSVLYEYEQTGDNCIHGCTQLHLKQSLIKLQQYAGCLFTVSEMVTLYKETITSDSSKIVMCRSQNRHNRIHAISYPIQEELSDLINSGGITLNQDRQVRTKRLCEDFGWEREDAIKIWSFGPDDCGPNILVDGTKGIQYMNEIKDSMIAAFQWSTKEGVLCQENTRGVRFDIRYCELHSDAIHRGGGQIIPTARRLLYALELSSNPSLLQPILSYEIIVPKSIIGNVYQCLSDKRGQIVEQVQIQGTSLHSIKSFLPVSESYGFNNLLKEYTHQKAIYSCMFDRWSLIKGLPFEDQNAKALVMSIRNRKGLRQGLPNINDYLDA